MMDCAPKPSKSMFCTPLRLPVSRRTPNPVRVPVARPVSVPLTCHTPGSAPVVAFHAFARNSVPAHWNTIVHRLPAAWVPTATLGGLVVTTAPTPATVRVTFRVAAPDVATDTCRAYQLAESV